MKLKTFSLIFKLKNELNNNENHKTNGIFVLFCTEYQITISYIYY